MTTYVVIIIIVIIIKGRDHSEDIGIYRRIILECILEKWGWIRIGQDRDQRHALVNTVMNLHMP
jgi:hypothetical protein